MKRTDAPITRRKYAVLDTDFISKANTVRHGNHLLADEVLSFPDYCFFAHKKLLHELRGRGTESAVKWLKEKSEDGRILIYSDERILQELESCCPGNSIAYFLTFLKKGCSLITADFYSNHFHALDEFNGEEDSASFLSVLHSCESSIGNGQSYGEVKAFILAEALHFICDDDVCVFCSDDSGARRGFTALSNIPCISILGVFLKLKLMGRSFEEVLPFFSSYTQLCTTVTNPEPLIKVWIYKSGSPKRVSVQMKLLLEDIYLGKYVIRRDGDLQNRTFQ